MSYTPTAAALKSALKVFNDRPNDVDSILAPGYVLLVTDGEPSCGGGPGEDATSTQSAIDMTNASIDALLKADIKTFVVGYDVTTAATTMNEFAKRGGTEKYIAVTSGKELEDALRKVAGALTPCTFRLAGTPSGPERGYGQYRRDGHRGGPGPGLVAGRARGEAERQHLRGRSRRQGPPGRHLCSMRGAAVRLACEASPSSRKQGG